MKMAKRRNKRRSEAEKKLREQELQKERNAATARKLMILVVIVAIVAVAWWAFGGGDDSGYEPTSGLIINEQGEVEILATEITKDATYYNIDANGVQVRFFYLRADDGKVRVAMDACDVCYENKKGYRQDGNDMVCNNCGNRYPISGLGTENKNPGGCWPGYLPSAVEGDNLVIEKSDIASGSWRFA